MLLAGHIKFAFVGKIVVQKFCLHPKIYTTICKDMQNSSCKNAMLTRLMTSRKKIRNIQTYSHSIVAGGFEVMS